MEQTEIRVIHEAWSQGDNNANLRGHSTGRDSGNPVRRYPLADGTYHCEREIMTDENGGNE